MRSAGKVVNFSHKGAIILRTDSPPSIGDIIVDRRSEKVGKVIRITGPVSSPYVIVNPVKTGKGWSSNSLLGRELYISDERGRAGSERKRRDRNTRKGGEGRRKGGGSGKVHGRDIKSKRPASSRFRGGKRSDR